MDQERTYKWIQERLRDLQAGRITEADLLRLEEMAKTDPFLADALAGFRAHPHIDHSERLHTIAHKVRFRREVKRKWLMPAIAASLLAVAGIWTLVDLTSREKTVFVAAEQQAPPVYEETIRDLPKDENIAADMTVSESVEEGTSSPSGLRAHAQSRLEADKTSTQQEDGFMLSDTKMESSDDYAVTQSVPPTTTFDKEAKQDVVAGSESPAAVQDGNVSESARNQVYDEGLYANQMDPAEMRKRVTGQVLNLLGEPLMGALVSVSSTNLITATDQYGRFEVFLPDETAGIDIHLSGFQDTVIEAVQGSQDIVIMLKENLVFGEADKIYAKTNALPRTQAEAGPVASSYNKRQEFMDFIRQHASFPVADEYMAGSKAVKIEFYLNEDHRPARIKVISSSGSRKHDEEAIRLLRQGPDWLCEALYPCQKEFTFFFK